MKTAFVSLSPISKDELIIRTKQRTFTKMARGIIFTHLDMKGDLTPEYIYPSTLDENLIHNITIKAATLVLTTLDHSMDYEGASILQLPEITVLVYYFLYPFEENGIEKQIQATISLFIESEFDWFFFREIDPLAQRIANLVNTIKTTGNVVEEDFKDLYNFLDSICRLDETMKDKRDFSFHMLTEPVTISDQQGFLDYYPFINLDLREEIVSHLIDGNFTIDDLSKNFRMSSCEIVQIFQRLFNYKLIELQNNATSD